MADVSIRVMSMNPKREYNIKVKGLNSEQLPDYVTKTYRDLIDLLGAEKIDIEVDASASSAIKSMEGNFFNVDAGYAITFDKRNQSFKPTQGYKTTFRQSLPIVQDSSWIRNGLDVSAYHDFSEDVIGSF